MKEQLHADCQDTRLVRRRNETNKDNDDGDNDSNDNGDDDGGNDDDKNTTKTASTTTATRTTTATAKMIEWDTGFYFVPSQSNDGSKGNNSTKNKANNENNSMASKPTITEGKTKGQKLH